MTCLEVHYRYAGKLTLAQRRKLGELTSRYGLRRLTVNEEGNQLGIEFGASRWRESEVVHVVRCAGIPLTERVEVSQKAGLVVGSGE